MKNTTATNKIPGLLVCFILALVSYALGKTFPVVGGAVFGILLGLIAGIFLPLDPLLPGIRLAGKQFLQYSIILLGFEMHLSALMNVGGQTLFLMVFTLSASFITAALMARLLKIPAHTAILIGVGTSICGGSAIAATAPVIRAKESDVASAISTIFLFNIVAVFLFPAVGSLLGLSDQGFGIWAGTAINDTSSVVAAASAWTERTGDPAALALATIVKLTRTLAIIPVTLVLAVYTARKERNDNPLGNFSMVKTFPWFVLGFVAAALFNSFFPLPPVVSFSLAGAGKFLIVVAMCAIGLSTRLPVLLSGGKRSVFLGLCCWAAVAVASLALQYFRKML